MSDAIERMWRRLLMVIGRGRATLVDDSGPVQRMQVKLSAAEVKDDMPRLAEYGFQSVPPAGSDVTLVFIGGGRSEGAVIATGNQTYRMRGLANGEVAISDDKGQHVYLSAAGIRIDGGGLPIEVTNIPSVLIDSPEVHMTGALHVDGEITGGGDIIAADNVADQGGTKTMAGMRGIYDTHTHVENDALGPTDPPSAPM